MRLSDRSHPWLYLRLKIKDKFLLSRADLISASISIPPALFPEFFRKKQNPAASRTDDGFRAILARFSISSISIPQGFQECRHRLSAPPDNFFLRMDQRSQSVRKSVKRSLSLSCSSSPPQKCKIIVTDSAECLVLLQLSFRQALVF